MTNSELNEFLGGYDYQSEIVEKLETLQQTLEQAMQPIVPKYKDNSINVLEEQSYIYENNNMNVYEKAVMIYLLRFDASWPQTMKEIARATGMSITSVKRVIRKGLEMEVIMKHPYESGYLLTKNYTK